jgi:hypothetical protein
VPNPRAFNYVSQDEGRVIKESAVMGFFDYPQRSLDDAAGNLRMMGWIIFYKKCQEVDTVATQVLVGAPKNHHRGHHQTEHGQRVEDTKTETVANNH